MYIVFIIWCNHIVFLIHFLAASVFFVSHGSVTTRLTYIKCLKSHTWGNFLFFSNRTFLMRHMNQIMKFITKNSGNNKAVEVIEVACHIQDKNILVDDLMLWFCRGVTAFIRIPEHAIAKSKILLSCAFTVITFFHKWKFVLKTMLHVFIHNTKYFQG